MSGRVQDAGEALTFWCWLKDIERYRNRRNPSGVAAAIVTPAAAVILSTLVFDLLLPDRGIDNDRDVIRFMLSFIAGAFVFFVMPVFVMPGNRRDAVLVSLLLLLAGFLLQAGMVAMFLTKEFTDAGDGPSFWWSLPLAVTAITPAVALALGVAWRFRGPALVEPPHKPDIPELLPILFGVLPASLVAGAAFYLVGDFVSDRIGADACFPNLGAPVLGSFVAFSGGLQVMQAWGRAGALRRTLLWRLGAGLLIGLAAMPLGRLTGCGIWVEPGQGLDWGLLLTVFGGYALPVYIAAGAFAWWWMDSFLRRHRLNRADDLIVAGDDTIEGKG